MLMFTFLIRTCIALLLLIAGIRWLARTTSITECMLNAVALNAILDVDELLGFQGNGRWTRMRVFASKGNLCVGIHSASPDPLEGQTRYRWLMCSKVF